MKTKPTIDTILILTGTEFKERASQIFKKYIFNKDKSLAAFDQLSSVTKVRVTDEATVTALNELVETKLAEYAAQSLNSSAQLKEQEWDMVGKLSGVTDNFDLYKNRSSTVINTTRVYLAYKDKD
ncbi:MAG: hypothetical protein WCI97_04515 [Bacteroidota bacterium]